MQRSRWRGADCPDPTFLGRRPDGRFRGESHGIFLSQPQELRIKHWVDKNSLKACARGHGRVLRGEFTMNHPEGFEVYRPKASDPDAYEWQPLRKGIADSYRHAQVSDQAVSRHLDRIATIDRPDPSVSSSTASGATILAARQASVAKLVASTA